MNSPALTSARRGKRIPQVPLDICQILERSGRGRRLAPCVALQPVVSFFCDRAATLTADIFPGTMQANCYELFRDIVDHWGPRRRLKTPSGLSPDQAGHGGAGRVRRQRPPRLHDLRVPKRRPPLRRPKANRQKVPPHNLPRRFACLPTNWYVLGKISL